MGKFMKKTLIGALTDLQICVNLGLGYIGMIELFTIFPNWVKKQALPSHDLDYSIL